jgi:hypothetical protein
MRATILIVTLLIVLVSLAGCSCGYSTYSVGYAVPVYYEPCYAPVYVVPGPVPCHGGYSVTYFGY